MGPRKSRYRIFRDGEWKDWMEPSDFSPSPPSTPTLVYYEESEPIDQEWWQKMVAIQDRLSGESIGKLGLVVEELGEVLSDKPIKITSESSWQDRQRQSKNSKQAAIDCWRNREIANKKRR